MQDLRPSNCQIAGVCRTRNDGVKTPSSVLHRRYISCFNVLFEIPGENRSVFNLQTVPKHSGDNTIFFEQSFSFISLSFSYSLARIPH